MDLELNDLLERFKTKGFMVIELPGLVKDVLNIVSTGGYSTITSIDQELEDLGWGIGIMDNVTYELVTSLIEDNSTTDVERHIHNMYLLEH
jgi:hypothetical protein